MKVRSKIINILIVFVFVTSGCLPNDPTAAVVETLQPETVGVTLPTMTFSPEALPATTFTSVEPSTATPIAELTLTSGIPTATIQSVVQPPYVYAPQNINCRLGPDMIYPAVGYLMLGETSEIVARNPQGTWVAVNNLDAPGICYVSLTVVEVHGIESVTFLAVFTPLPSPTLTPAPLLPLFTRTPRPAEPQPTITYTAELPTAPNPDDPRIDVDPGSGPAGTVFVFLIRDFKPFEQVTIVIENYEDVEITRFDSTMDANGDKDVSWTSPIDLPVNLYSVIPIDSTGKPGKSGAFVIDSAN